MRRKVYDSAKDHTRGLTAEICWARLQQIDERLLMERRARHLQILWESRDWFALQLRRLMREEDAPSVRSANAADY